MNCVCQNGAQRPGVQEVIDTLQRSTVCTGTQCFETQADAFGLTAAPQGPQADSTAFWMMMTYALCPPILKMGRDRQQSRPSRVSRPCLACVSVPHLHGLSSRTASHARVPIQ
jgi:hypothetical protein